MSQPQQSGQVVVVDIHMPFWSMVTFLVKLAIASIPAFVLLVAIGFAASALVGGLATGLQFFKSGSTEEVSVEDPVAAAPVLATGASAR